MKKLIITFYMKDIEKYGKKNNKVSLIQLDYDIQQVLITNKVRIEDIESNRITLGEKDCYELKFAIVDMTIEQKTDLINKIEKIINIRSLTIEENEFKI